MAGIKSFAKAMLCSRDFRNFIMAHRNQEEGEKNHSIKSQSQVVQRGGGITSDIQLGDFFEAMTQYSLVGNAESGTFSECTLQDWKKRGERITCAIQSCYQSEAYDSLIELIGYDDLRKYLQVHAHPGTIDDLNDMWRKFHRKFPSSLNLHEGEWAREVSVNLEFGFPLEGIESVPMINLSGRCDLVQELPGDTFNIIELKATKKIQSQHTYQINLYGIALPQSRIYMCHKGKTFPVLNHFEERIEILSANPNTKTYCPQCQNLSCVYRY
jgi:hypothetical protein